MIRGLSVSAVRATGRLRFGALAALLLALAPVACEETPPPKDPSSKIDPAELHLDFARPTVELLRTISLGRTWTTLRSKRLLVHRAVAAEPALVRAAGSPGPGELAVAGEAVLVGTADGALQLLEVQPEGRARQDATAWRNGSRPQPGELLGR